MKSVFVYTREAHPGERYAHHTSVEQKLEFARDMVKAHGIRRPMLVDDLDGTLHTAYGRLPNMSYVLGGGGKVLYRASWTEPGNLKTVIDSILEWRRSQREDGVAYRPYYVEWEASVRSDRLKFVETLLEEVGPIAVQEYIDAVGHELGEGLARPLREWWAERRRRD